MGNLPIFDGLPFNLDDLINVRSVESNRIDFKATWNDYIKNAAIHCICALANDLLNLNGGYIVLGIEETEGHPILPPRGLEGLDLEKLQKEIRGACKRIQPEYQPVLFPAIYQEKQILIIWVPGGDNRPYQAPESLSKQGSPYLYFVRQGPECVKAKGALLQQLMESAAKIPFDDRRNLEARIEDVSPSLVRHFLNDIRSDLVGDGRAYDDRDLYRKLRILDKINDHEVPRNVGLLFFTDDPDRFFKGTRIEVVQFRDDAGGDLIEERYFRGPLHQQIKNTLDYLDGFGGSLLQKVRGQAEVERTVPYPYEAMEEAIVNAIYHRGYDGPPEPVKVYLYPDRMQVTSYPGPVAGILKEHFKAGASIPMVPARNRRVGEFLKELRLAEGRGTGIPKIQRKMHENGSPEATFDFDDSRTYFQVTLPVHPRYQVLHSLREAAHLWAIGEKVQAVGHLERAFERQPSSGAIASLIIEYAFALNKDELALHIFSEFEKQTAKIEASQPFLTIARLLLDRNKTKEANEILKRIPSTRTNNDTLEAAILKKRTQDYKGAHHLFAEAYSINPNDPKIIHEFAQTKIRLAQNMRHDIQTKKRLNLEAVELLRKVIQLCDDPVRVAWCWYDLAKTLRWLREPKSEIETAYLRAQALNPGENIFKEGYQDWKRNLGK